MNILSLPAYLEGVSAEKAGGLSVASPRHAQKRDCGLFTLIPNANRFTIFVPIELSGYDFKCVVIKYYPKQDCALCVFFFAVK